MAVKRKTRSKPQFKSDETLTISWTPRTKLGQLVKYIGGDQIIRCKKEGREEYELKHNQVFKVVLITFNRRGEVIYKLTLDLEEDFREDNIDNVWTPYKMQGRTTWCFEYELKKYRNKY